MAIVARVVVAGAALMLGLGSAWAQSPGSYGYYYFGPSPYEPVPEYDSYYYAPPPPPAARFYVPPPEGYEEDYYAPYEMQPPRSYGGERRYNQPYPRYERSPQVPRAQQPKRAPSQSANRSTGPAQTGPRGPVDCNRAQEVVAGYGFGNVKPVSCTGKLYSFSGLRDGKDYRVQVSAATGEITEVKKQP